MCPPPFIPLYVPVCAGNTSRPCGCSFGPPVVCAGPSGWSQTLQLDPALISRLLLWRLHSGPVGAFSFSCQLLPTHLRCPLRMGEKLFCLCYTQGGQADCVATLHSVGLGCVARCLGCCSMPASCKTAALRRHVGCIYAKSSLSQCNQIVCLQVAMCVRVR